MIDWLPNKNWNWNKNITS